MYELPSLSQTPSAPSPIEEFPYSPTAQSKLTCPMLNELKRQNNPVSTFLILVLY
jgi:hypothetical protein